MPVVVRASASRLFDEFHPCAAVPGQAAESIAGPALSRGTVYWLGLLPSLPRLAQGLPSERTAARPGRARQCVGTLVQRGPPRIKAPVTLLRGREMVAWAYVYQRDYSQVHAWKTAAGGNITPSPTAVILAPDPHESAEMASSCRPLRYHGLPGPPSADAR